MTGRRHLRVPVSRGELPRTVRFFCADEVHERINEGQVGESLPKVAGVTAIHRIQLLGVEPQWTGMGQQAFAQCFGAEACTGIRRKDQLDRCAA
jgi:hypothetical protein